MLEKNVDLIDNLIMELIGNRWKLIIIKNLMDGTKRFGELKKQVGDITQKVLTTNLKILEQHGLLVREVYAQIPPRVEYTLTSVGESLKPIIDALMEWASEYKKSLI
ncbi:MAG: winged helix-turn-helix transcriptional regulator [Alphaproteobacteria bacterium]|nr:winged helix-turn-helix transcriptional regulator [Alphaproteobacteria bacterium]